MDAYRRLFLAGRSFLVGRSCTVIFDRTLKDAHGRSFLTLKDAKGCSWTLMDAGRTFEDD